MAKPSSSPVKKPKKHWQKWGEVMKITEMLNCIEQMRECYKFDNDKTEIRLGDLADCGHGRLVQVATQDENGTSVMLKRHADELVQLKSEMG